MRDTKQVVIAGAGTMGSSMGATFAKHGFQVMIYDISAEALESAKRTIGINLETETEEGILTREEADELLRRLSFTADKEAFRSADFAVEAILENLKIKHLFWEEISKLVPEDAILASNTSGLGITEIAKAVHRPERFGGMHWINPPHIIPLIEVIQGEETSESTVQAIFDMAIRLGKKPVKVKDAPGFVLNRIQFAILRECLHIAESGIATMEDIDNVMKYGLGPRYACLGPFQVADLGGLDVFHNISSYLFAELATQKDSFHLLKRCAEEGRFGVKSGAGFYDYSDGKDVEAIRHRDEMYTKIAKTLFGGERK